MATELASVALSAPVTTQPTISTLDSAGTPPPQSSSGSVQLFTLGLVNGAVVGSFTIVDQSQQVIPLTTANVPAGSQANVTAALTAAETALLTLLRDLLAAKLPNGVTATVTAG